MGRGTRGLGDVGTRVRGDAGTWGLGDVGTRGRGDVVREDFGKCSFRTIITVNQVAPERLCSHE